MSPMATLNADVALAQSQMAQNAPKEAVKAAMTEKKGLDPASLVGEWKGQWSAPGMSDSMYLTMKPNSKGEISCSVFINGRARYHNRDLPSKCESAEGRLIVSNDYITIDFTEVSPSVMRGRGRGDRGADIELGKVK